MRVLMRLRFFVPYCYKCGRRDAAKWLLAPPVHLPSLHALINGCGAKWEAHALIPRVLPEGFARLFISAIV
jgi:hypothetical protein